MIKIFLFVAIYCLPIACHSIPPQSQWLISCQQGYESEQELLKLGKPFVTIFGSSRIEENDPYFKQAYTLAKTLANKGYIILTGGNTGIMQAANCGALAVTNQGITSISLNVNGQGDENLCSHKKIYVDELYVRKKLMTTHASAFLIFPGGSGTLDELSDIIGAMEESTQQKIYIIGKDFWQHLKHWLEEAVKQKLISPFVLEKIVFTDNMEEIEKSL